MASETRLLKANIARNLGARVAFNYEDLQRQCDDYIAQVRMQADQLLSQASSDAEKIRKDARESSSTIGRQEGLRHARDDIANGAAELARQMLAEQLQHAVPALDAAISGLEIERDRWLATWENTSVRLAVAIAEKIIRRQLDRQPELSAEIISEALQLAAGQPRIRVTMHSADIELFRNSGLDIAQRLGSLGQAELVPDDRIARGGCHIETQHGVIDARLETQLQRVAEEMTNELSC